MNLIYTRKLPLVTKVHSVQSTQQPGLSPFTTHNHKLPPITVNSEMEKLDFTEQRTHLHMPFGSKKVARLAGYGIRIIRPILKTKMFIYQSKANLVEKISFGTITHL